MSIDQVVKAASQIFQTQAPPEEIIKIICEEASITKQDLFSNKRPAYLVLWRQASYYLLREKYGLSYPQIGQLMGGKHHTTVMHGVTRFESYWKEYHF